MRLRTALRIALAAGVRAALTYGTFSSIRISRDLSFFQPGQLSETSALAVEQVRRGPASRLILVALERAPAPRLAELSRALVGKLASSPDFLRITNGAV